MEARSEEAKVLPLILRTRLLQQQFRDRSRGPNCKESFQDFVFCDFRPYQARPARAYIAAASSLVTFTTPRCMICDTYIAADRMALIVQLPMLGNERNYVEFRPVTH
jgi:hypothetical protein